MDSELYKKWWALHLRHARGEALSTAEQAEYQLGRDVLEREESSDFADPSFEKLRGEIADSLAEIQRLQEENKRLDQEIAQLGNALEKTRKTPQPVEG